MLVILFVAICLIYLIYKLLGKNFEIFVIEYTAYLSQAPEHRANLFESIIGGIFTGLTTFLALFITIIHENKKNKETWEKEREREVKRRLWEIQPVLNLSIHSISAARKGLDDNKKDVINIGEGDKYIYLKMSIENRGKGECRNIYLNKECFSISQLGIEVREFTLYLDGFKDETFTKNIKFYFTYQDSFGHHYIQNFILKGDFSLKDSSEIHVEMESPKLIDYVK